MTVGIIGSGHLGSAIAHASREAMFGVGVFDRNPEKIEDPATRLSLDRVTMADLVVIAVKPQDFSGLVEQIHHVALGEQSIVVSVMAGVPLARLVEELRTTRVVRSLPSLAAKVNESMTVWMPHPSLTPEERGKVQKLFDAIGDEIEVEREELLDAAAVTGCIPGWLYHTLALFEEEAQRIGFSPEQAQEIVHQMFLGAAEITEEEHRSFAAWRDAVASKGGVTIAGIATFSKRDFSGMMREVFDAALKRTRELGS